MRVLEVTNRKGERVEIPVTPKNEPTRLLGAWITPSGDHTVWQDRFKDEQLAEAVEIMKVFHPLVTKPSNLAATTMAENLLLMHYSSTERQIKSACLDTQREAQLRIWGLPV